MPVARPTLPLAWTWTSRAFVGTDAGALDVTGDADADMPALRPKARLLFSKKILIADHLQRLVEDRLVIAAVVRERREVLIDDLVVVGKGIRRNEIAPVDSARSISSSCAAMSSSRSMTKTPCCRPAPR